MHRSTFLSPKLKLPLHIIVLILAVSVIIMTGIYLNMGVRPSRAEIMLIPFGVKSIIIIGYQLLSEHVARFARWKSLKANAILNCLEVVFWLAAVVLKFQSIAARCVGSSCVLNSVIAATAILISIISIHVAILSVVEHRSFKRYGTSIGMTQTGYDSSEGGSPYARK